MPDEASTRADLCCPCSSIWAWYVSMQKTAALTKWSPVPPLNRWHWRPWGRRHPATSARPSSSRKARSELASITAALIAAALLGIWFNVTRWISIAAFGVLCLLYAWLGAFVIGG